MTRSLLCMALCHAVDILCPRISRASVRLTRALEHWLDMDYAPQLDEQDMRTNSKETRQ